MSKENANKPLSKSEILKQIKDRQEKLRLIKIEDEAEAKRIQEKEEELERQQKEQQRLEEERQQKKRTQERNRIQRQREEGTYLTKRQRQQNEKRRVQFEAAGIQIPKPHTLEQNHDPTKSKILYEDHRKKIDPPCTTTESTIELNEDTDESDDAWERISDEEKFEIIDLPKANGVNIDIDQYQPSSSSLRAPVICVLGHVDAGKTTLLDNLRQSSVQAHEAGGITQQIGATNVPLETLQQRTQVCRSNKQDILVPGLLIIDTPGHETFKNLRLRGSSLCDLAILVVDLMHGLEPQTIESIELLKQRNTPFIIALNKVDLLYGWKGNREKDIKEVIDEQTTFTKQHFETRFAHVRVQFAEQGLNVALYHQNPDPNEYYSMVPTSALSSDGMGSLIAQAIQMCQTTLVQRLTYADELQATVMEVKVGDGIGTAIDVALISGCLSVNDKIIIAGQEGSIVTRIRRILIPDSNQELRVTDQYKTKDKVYGACGVKIVAKDLEKAMAGFPLFIVRTTDEIECYKHEFEQMIRTALDAIELKDKGVYVQSSTLGALEAFIQLLKTANIPCAGVNIGPVHRKDVMRASSQLEKDTQYGTILAFDVRIEKDAQDYAKSIGVKICQSNEIYQLRDMFIAYHEEIKSINREKYKHLAVFPCKLKILSNCVFRSRDPIICGVRVEDGFIRLNTPICVPSKNFIELGRIVAIEKNHKSIETAEKGSEVCIKIQPIPGETPKLFGRHFDENDYLISEISRESIDTLKLYFRNELQTADWRLIIELKKIFDIV